ncbi:hypothetical protein ABG807_07130 [Streptococcus iniae]
MSKMKQLNDMITEMENTVTQFNALIMECKQLLSSSETDQSVETKPESTPMTFSMEEVRAVLAEKAADGYKNEVRALLQAYEASSLSTLSPEHYGAVIEEYGVIGND